MGALLMHVAVIGAGCAGLAAASRLASAGVRVTVLEAAGHPGGRARTIPWKGWQLDNGQHILLGACRETLLLLEDAGVDCSRAFLRLPLRWISTSGFEWRAWSWLPAPLHVAAGILTARGLSWRNRFSALRLMGELACHGPGFGKDELLSDFLHRHGQSADLIQGLWGPLCLAALNTPPEQASAHTFLRLVRDCFTRSGTASDVLLPRQDLSALLAEPLGRKIRQAGGKLLCNRTVTSVGLAQDGGFTLACRGETRHYSHVVVAVPFFRAGELLSGLPIVLSSRFEFQPIYTVYLKYPEGTTLPFPMMALSSGHAQWVFDRGALCGQAGLLAVVISASGAHQKIPAARLAGIVADELAQAFPAFPGVEWSKVIAEKRATFASTPGLQRPPQTTGVPGLYLAGDYTAGDYPATIESAVSSGVRCAHLILGTTKTTA